MSSRYRKTNCRVFISSQSSTKTANVAKIGRVDLEIFGLTDIVKKAHTHTRLTALCPGLPGWAGTRKAKPVCFLSEARDNEWHWHQLGHMQVCTSLHADNLASTPPLSFFTGRMPFLPPNQQCQSTEGNSTEGNKSLKINKYKNK